MLDRPSAPTTVPLNRLRFGDDKPGGSAHTRTSNRRDNLDELAASLLALGVIQPLTIEAWGSEAYVVDGNRRLAALRKLVADGRIAKDYPVKVAALDEGTNPTEASLAANIMHLPMHEIDQHEAFARLAAEGQDVAEIASHFGASELMVRRRLALGKLSPKIRAAWRDGKVPVDAAQAFTLVDDQDLQDATYQALAKGQNLYRGAVIRALTGGADSWRNDRYLAFVGRKAFVKAGGRLAEDLFEPDAPKMLDPELLLRLTRAKVEAACAQLVAEGWRWAVWEQDLPAGHYAWHRAAPPEPVFLDGEDEARTVYERLKARAAGQAENGSALTEIQRRNASFELTQWLRGPIGLRSCPPDVRAATGCKVLILDRGKLDVSFGYIRPDDAHPDDAVAASRSEAEAARQADASLSSSVAAAPAGISAALAQTLSEQRTLAAAGAVCGDPHLALRLVVAALQSRSGPVRIAARGWAGLAGQHGIGSQTWPQKVPGFAEAFALTEGSDQPALLDELASLVAASLDLTDASRLHPAMAVRGQDELVAALDPQWYLGEARQVFDPEGYFDRVPAKLAVAAIAEMGGARNHAGEKKAELVGRAAALARDTGWLPEPLRCAGYRIMVQAGEQAGTS